MKDSGKVNILAFLVCFLIAVSADLYAGGVWINISEDKIPPTNQLRRIIPSRYQTYRLRVQELQSLLRLAPAEFSEESRHGQIELKIPYPDGTFHRFRIENSPIMEEKLAKQFPEILTFKGQGIDEPAATIRFDWTPKGFHAMIFSPGGLALVDPYRSGDVEHYISYFKKDYQNPADSFECHVENSISKPPPLSETIAAPVTLRSYRVAIAATGEYTQFHGRTVNDGLAAITTTLNRVNGIYERDFAVRMNLVANETNVIFTNPATDPYRPLRVCAGELR